jgi:Leu/Phe-tRNA-protein transferase
MADDVRFYKGKFKVRVLAESRGHWIVEALEPFEDDMQGEKVKVKKGERRIVAPNLLHTRQSLPPRVKEHTYELKMEKKLKRLVDDEERKNKI